jgi:hypothetical protein
LLIAKHPGRLFPIKFFCANLLIFMSLPREFCAKYRLGYKRFEGESFRLQVWFNTLLNPAKEKPAVGQMA